MNERMFEIRFNPKNNTFKVYRLRWKFFVFSAWQSIEAKTNERYNLQNAAFDMLLEGEPT